MQTEQLPNNTSQNIGLGDSLNSHHTLKRSLPSSTSIKSMITQGMEEEILEQQTAYSHSELTFALKKDCLEDMMSLTNERDSKQEYFSDTEIGALEHNNNTNKTSNKSYKKKKENSKGNNLISSSKSKSQNDKNRNNKKNKRELRCKTVIIQQEKKSHAHRLDFDFLVFDSLKYAENKSPLSMACYHKSIDKFEMNRKEKLLTIHMDTLEKIKTPITLILKKLISDSHTSAKDLCDSLYYFHKLLKRFRMIRENNTDKINIFKQLMPILPNHQTPEQVLASDPKYPSLTATYKINAKKGTISLDKYTFNEKLAHLLGFPTLDHLKQNIQFTKRFPSLSVPNDYYSYIMECLLNKFEKQRSSVCKGFVKTFDGIKVGITEKIVSRCHIDSDITPEEINVLQQNNSKGINKCKLEEDEYDYANKQDDDEDDDNDDENSPQGILYVMTKHFFFIENQDLSNYIFSKERLAICESIDYSSLHEESLPRSDLPSFNYIHAKSVEANSKLNSKLYGDKLKKKRNLNNNNSNSEEQENQQHVKQEFIATISSPNSIQSTSAEEIQKQQVENNNSTVKKEEFNNLNGIDLLEIIKQSLLLNQYQFSSPQNLTPFMNLNIQNASQLNQTQTSEADSQQNRCSYRILSTNAFDN